MMQKNNLHPSTSIIIGGGLVGSLLAIYLRQKNQRAIIYESRDDIRLNQRAQGRSINLVLTNRGLNALKKVGLDQEILKLTNPVSGRMIHQKNIGNYYQPYGVNGECNYSVSRLALNQKLLSLAEELGAELNFNVKISSPDQIDHLKQMISINSHQVQYDFLYGTDGINSIIRKKVLALNNGEENLSYLNVDYKEFLMPAKSDGDHFLIDEKSLHIWPNGKHFVMGLPNQDGTFTMTLYLAPKNENEMNDSCDNISFDQMHSASDYQNFLSSYYPELLELVPDASNQLWQNPQGKLATLKCSPWYYDRSILLLGDASHAITPFFGQGMNSGFEDIFYWDQYFNLILNGTELSWKNYFLSRKINTDAIAEMALENYFEMSEKVKNPDFIFCKKIEQELERKFPEKFHSRYHQVMYGLNPYKEAFDLGVTNQKLINQIANKFTHLEEINWTWVSEIMTQNER